MPDDPLSSGDALMPQALHDALAAVRSQGRYYGGAPQVPGPAVRLPMRMPAIRRPPMRPAANVNEPAAMQEETPHLVSPTGRKISVPDHQHLIDALRSYDGDIDRTLEGFRQSYANYPRPERLEDIITLEQWKQQGLKLFEPNK